MLHKIFNYIKNLHIEPDSDKFKRIDAQRLNLFAFSIGVILLLNGLRDLFFGFKAFFGGLFILGGIFLILFFFTKARQNALICLIAIELSLLLVFYFSSTSGFGNGLSLYYFVLITTSLFVFNTRETSKHIIVVFATAFILFLTSHYYDFRIFRVRGVENLEFSKNQRLFAFISVFVWFAILGYFILSKQFMILELYQKVLHGEKIIANMREKLNRKDDIDLENLVKFAINDDIAFIPKMKSSFPNLYDNLTEINPDMTGEEFKLCALIKLGFTTKDIAEYNHISVRTVQTRKSRLRKAFEISSDTDLYKWIDTF
ncbi:regulatory LuxR family protein [Chryseobacterium sp. 7]|uniref:helix-turn-helix transcriptional regulator n=1 Tax=Chryseobacterium sp. 7 TaxID=2035214 RepID=UPI000F2238B3|nr:LuxR C-terminal-related transcriptional regulator [Chryseobacterium sp. 7]RLJ32965.1 regulatory LuxR family protein [Chryseobacterium sp. 7]